ncbi:MAG: hypothetical protein KKA05_05630 [Alphaproteobacteria bacterium]|nr:hypothetical protein [Alphaproteobacteria bacterium]
MTVIGFQNNEEAQKAEEAMACVMEHYIKHHQVVLKKLTHAHDATVTSIREIEAMMASLDAADIAESELAEVRKYDGLWLGIIDMFRQAGMSESELVQIEGVLKDIPRAIKTHYDVLLKHDKALMAMIEDLNAEKYRQAFEVIKKAQSGPNLMSGLDPSEYELEEEDPANPTDDTIRKGKIIALPIKKKPSGKGKRH